MNLLKAGTVEVRLAVLSMGPRLSSQLALDAPCLLVSLGEFGHVQRLDPGAREREHERGLCWRDWND